MDTTLARKAQQPEAVCFLLHWPYPLFEKRAPDVIRHTALRSSDFPPPPERLSDAGRQRSSGRLHNIESTPSELPQVRNRLQHALRHYDEGSAVEVTMEGLDRITQNPGVMQGKACIRGMRVTVGMIVGQLSTGTTIDEMLEAYPYLEREDILQALRYAGMLVGGREVVLAEA